MKIYSLLNFVSTEQMQWADSVAPPPQSCNPQYTCIRQWMCALCDQTVRGYRFCSVIRASTIQLEKAVALIHAIAMISTSYSMWIEGYCWFPHHYHRRCSNWHIPTCTTRWPVQAVLWVLNVYMHHLCLYSLLLYLGRFFKFVNPIHSRQKSLDWGSARRKAAAYTQDNTYTE
jgi:hypothetical protein